MASRRAVLALLPAAALAGCGLFRAGRDDEAEGMVAQLGGLVADGDTLFLSGTIEAGTADALSQMTANLPALREVVMLDVNAPQGAPGALALGRAIRAAGLDTRLRSESNVTGGAADAFLGGAGRTMEEGAVLAVRRLPRGRAEAHAAYVAEMLGNAAYHDYVRAEAPALGRQPLSVAAIGTYGLLTGPIEEVIMSERAGSIL